MYDVISKVNLQTHIINIYILNAFENKTSKRKKDTDRYLNKKMRI